MERFASVVRFGSVVVAERRLSKRLLKVVVYTPLVTVPALPEMLPVMVLLKVWVPPHVFEVVVPNAEVNTPVEELYARGYEAERDEDEILLLKTDQSVPERSPRTEAAALGRLKVIVFPAAVIVKSVPVVEDARSCVPPVCVWPAGPNAVMPAPLVESVVPSYERPEPITSELT